VANHEDWFKGRPDIVVPVDNLTAADNNEIEELEQGNTSVQGHLAEEAKADASIQAEEEKWREKWRESGFDEQAEKEKWREFGKTQALTSVQLKALLALPPQTCGPHGLRKRVRAPACCADAQERQGMQQYPGGGSPVASLLAAVWAWGARVTGARSRGTRRRQDNTGQVLDTPDMPEKAPSKEKNTAMEV
jgi:hypothetical protein